MPIMEWDGSDDRAEIDVEAAKVRALAVERMNTPMPATFLAVRGKCWPQDTTVRDLLEIINGWGDLAKMTLYRFGAEAMGIPNPSRVKMLGAVYGVQHHDWSVRDAIRRAANDAVLFHYWGLHKVVYAVHAGLLEALRDTAGVGEIPASVLRQLPHPNPLFVFPKGIMATLPDGSKGCIRGFFVTGLLDVERDRQPGAIRVSSDHTDPEPDGYQISMFSQVGEIELPPQDWDLSSVTVTLNRNFTLQEAALTSAKGWDVDPNVRRMASEEIEDWTTLILNICLPVLLYACSSEPDVELQPRPPAKRSSPGGKPKASPRVNLLGYRVGPPLDRARYQPAPRRGGAPTGRTTAAHVRRAHWHTFRVGPGRAWTTVKWLPPIPVNSKEGEVADLPTVIPVKEKK